MVWVATSALDIAVVTEGAVVAVVDGRLVELDSLDGRVAVTGGAVAAGMGVLVAANAVTEEMPDSEAMAVVSGPEDAVVLAGDTDMVDGPVVVGGIVSAWLAEIGQAPRESRHPKTHEPVHSKFVGPAHAEQAASHGMQRPTDAS